MKQTAVSDQASVCGKVGARMCRMCTSGKPLIWMFDLSQCEKRDNALQGGDSFKCSFSLDFSISAISLKRDQSHPSVSSHSWRAREIRGQTTESHGGAAHIRTRAKSHHTAICRRRIHTDTCMRTKTQTDMGAGFKIKQRWVVSVCSTCLWNLCTAQSVPATAAPRHSLSSPTLLFLLLLLLLCW